MKKKNAIKKSCSLCGKNYFRRNLVEVWVSQAPGKRLGWQKEKLRVCLACQPQRDSLNLVQRVVNMARVTLSKS